MYMLKTYTHTNKDTYAQCTWAYIGTIHHHDDAAVVEFGGEQENTISTTHTNTPAQLRQRRVGCDVNDNVVVAIVVVVIDVVVGTYTGYTVHTFRPPAVLAHSNHRRRRQQTNSHSPTKARSNTKLYAERHSPPNHTHDRTNKHTTGRLRSAFVSLRLCLCICCAHCHRHRRRYCRRVRGTVQARMRFAYSIVCCSLNRSFNCDSFCAIFGNSSATEAALFKR